MEQTTNTEGVGMLYSGSVADIANIIVAFSILAGGLMAVFFIFFAGIQFITSGGEEEKTQKAVKSIRYAIIGLFVVIFSVTFVAILGSIFNFDLVPFIYWDKMREIMQQLIIQYSTGSTIAPPSGVSIQPNPIPQPDVTYTGTPPPGIQAVGTPIE